MSELSQLAQFIVARPWAIIPGTFRNAATLQREMGEYISRLYARTGVTPEAIAAARQQSQTSGGVAVIPIHGVLTQRQQGGLFEMLFGGTSYEAIGSQIAEADNRDDVVWTVLDIDSPGGEVYGLEPLVQQMQARKGGKRLVAVANAVAGSAAYHIASQADEIVVAPGGEVGSIGVIGIHHDDSKRMEEAGIVETVIGMPEGKTDEWAAQLSDATREHHESKMAEHYSRFVANVAKGRGTTPAKVKAGFGGGRMVMDTAAKAAGMVDRVATLADTVTRLSGGGRSTGRCPRATAAAIRAQTGVWD